MGVHHSGLEGFLLSDGEFDHLNMYSRCNPQSEERKQTHDSTAGTPTEIISVVKLLRQQYRLTEPHLAKTEQVSPSNHGR
ncbi:hypothetical protein AGIG_G20971 [Arapaima gigas]